MANEIVEVPLEEVLALPVYATADIFPMLLDEAKAPDGYESLTIHQLSDELASVGVRVPLVVWKGFLLDGRNRREAARIANKINGELLNSLPVRYEEFETEEEADSWVLSLNIDHRTLNKDQLACIAIRYWEIEKSRLVGQGTRTDLDSNLSRSDKDKNKDRTAKRLADRFHVSNSYISKAQTLYLNDQPKFNLAISGRKKVIGSLVSAGQTITPETDPVEAAEKKLNNAVNAVVSSVNELLNLGGDLELEHVWNKLNDLTDTLDQVVTSATQPEKYFKPDIAPCDDSYRWAAEVRVRVAGIDRMINEKGVKSEEIARETNPLFQDAVGRMVDVLREVQKAFNNG